MCQAGPRAGTCSLTQLGRRPFPVEVQFLIKLADLELLPDAAGVSVLQGEELQRRLRRIFRFLPTGTRFTVDGGVVEVSVPKNDDKAQSEAERLARTGARKASKGDYGRAKQLLRKALELDPSLAEARRDLAMICSEMGEHEQAKDLLIDVLRSKPDDAWAYVVLANHYSKTEDNKPMAEKLLRKALELNPEDSWALNSMAVVVLEQGREDEGLGYFDAAIRSNPRMANAHYGKALVFLRRSQFDAAEVVLEALFANCPLQDMRSAPMLEQARTAYFRVENILGNNRLAESKAVVGELLQQAEAQSGYPVVESTGKLAGSVAAQVRMAWKHDSDHHELVMREGDTPEIVRHHMCAHELYHVLMESAARDAGTNRWFTTSEESKRRALQSMEREIAVMEKSGIPRNTSVRIMNDVFTGAVSLLYNCPLDMRVEKRIRENHVALKQAQFCSVFILAQDARNATFNQKVRDILPRTILRVNDSLNGAYALFVDELFHGATDFAEPFRKLPTFGLAKQLHARWQELDKKVPFGEEWRIVDALAEILGLRDWYGWNEDRGFVPPDGTDTQTREGVTNPGLLKEKQTPAVMYLLGALQRYSKLSPEQIRGIAAEIAQIGQEGLDYASPDQKYKLKSLPGEVFSGLHLMCLMYAGFKHVAPDLDTGMDLNDAYLAALEMFNQC